MYIVKQEDLIGELKGFPIEIAQRLIECQLEQGNKDDITIFQQNICESKINGGFDWGQTTENIPNWLDILISKNFKLFFDKYYNNTHIYYRGVIDRGEDIINALKKVGGRFTHGQTGGACHTNCLYYIRPIDHEITVINDNGDINNEALWLLKECYKEKFLY